MKIGVSGASGHLGRAVLAELAARGGGHTIVGVSRTPETVAAPAEGRFGDYNQPESLLTAYAGLDRLLIIPSTDLEPGVRGGQFKAAVDAAVAAGVGHIVIVSASGTREAIEPELRAAYWAGEQRLLQIAPRWTILRMNYYAESMADEIKASLATGVLPGLGAERVAYVSRDDLAAAAAGLLTSDGHAGAIYHITGPQVVTGEERAALVSEITGKPFTFIVLPADHLRGALAQAQLPPRVIDAVLELKSNFVAGAFDILTTDMQRLSGRAPKSMGDVLKARL